MDSKLEQHLVEERFLEVYGKSATFGVFCPGRVNLIGEHIDYNGYGVLPMAISLGTWLLVAPGVEENLEIRNFDPEYGMAKVNLPSEWRGCSPPTWSDYILCGWRGIIDALGLEQKPMQILVKGTIPPSSGLSSSSSLVCAAAFATLVFHSDGKISQKFTREWFADLCAKAEQMIGTCGGGMDQASEILSHEGAALRIDFNPLRSHAVHLPDNALFTVLHSGDTLNKAASSQFNERVIECRIATQILGKHMNLENWNSMRKLKEVQEKSNLKLDELLQLVEKVLPESPDADEVKAVIGEENFKALLSANTQHMVHFNVRARARHCYSEALRVERFEAACEAGDLILMGKLMNESHDSLKVDYECSSNGLDHMVAESRKAGFLGVRLTGAGWGGCGIALMDKSKPTFMPSSLNPLFCSTPQSGIVAYAYPQYKCIAW